MWKYRVNPLFVFLGLVVLAFFNTTGTRSEEPTSGEQINWDVVSTGASDCGSTNYQLGGTVGQTAVGYESSASYGLNSGFWQNFGCCIGIRGNVDGDAGDKVNVSDLTYLVSYLFKGGPEPPCFEEGDVNGHGTINVSDLTYLVSYLFKGGPAPPPCS